MTKKCLFVSCVEGVSSMFSREHPLFPFFSHHFICFPLSHFSFLICHFSLYNIGCNVLKMKSYENLMQNIRLLQKEVLLLHLI